MPQAVAYVAAVAANFIGQALLATGSLTIAEIGATVTYAAVEVGIYAGISIATAEITAPSIPGPQALQTPIKQAMPVRQSAFGRVRVGGCYALFTAGDGDEKVVSANVLALLDGLSHQFVNYYLNDDLMAQNAGGYWYAPGAYGKYGQGDGVGNLVQIGAHLGLATETAHPISAIVARWTSDHRGDGVTSLAVLCKQAHPEDQPSCFPNGDPTPSAVIDSQLIYDPRDGTQTLGTASSYKFSDTPPLCLLAYLTDAAGGMGLDYGRFLAPTIGYLTAAADECDGLISVSGMHATLLDAAAAGDTKIFLADTTGLTAGVAVDLPTETVTVSGLGLAGEVDITGTLTYAHQAGELAYWDASGQQARYRCAGAYRHDNAPGDVVKSILSTFDGWLGARGDGALVLRTGALYAPSVTLTDRHIVGYQVQHYLPDEQATNQLIVSYTDPASAFNKAEAGYVQDDIDIAARGQLRSQELSLDWVPSGPQAIAVARAVLARATQPLRGTVSCNLAGLAVMGERYVRLQIGELPALNDVIVEVTGRVAIDLSAMTVSFPWTATNARLSSSAAICFAIDLSTSMAGSRLTNLKAGMANALSLIGATLGAVDVAVVAFGNVGGVALSEVKRAATAADLFDLNAWVQARTATADDTDFRVGMTSSKAFFDATDAAIATRTLIWMTDGEPTAGGFGSGDPPATIAAGAAAILATMSGVASYAINIELTDTTYTVACDNTPADGVPVAPTAGDLMAYIEQALFGSVSSSGSGYTLPPLGPPSGSPSTPLAAPTITTVTADYPDSGGGIAGARLLIEVDDEGDVAWKVRWKLSADTSWTELTVSDPTGSPPLLLTGLITATGTVDVEVAYLTAGQVSPWSATSTVTVAAPVAGQPYGFSFQRAVSGVVVSTSLVDFDTPEAWMLPASLPDCQASLVAEGSTAAVAPSAQTDFDIQVAGVSVGTLRFAATALTATFIKASATSVALGAITSIVAPANLNGMAGRLIGALKGTR